MRNLLSSGVLIVSLATVMVLCFAPSPARALDESGDKKQIIERVIKIEGSRERPRILFIVPKARLWESDILNKSFREEFLEPVLPAPPGRFDAKRGTRVD